jgi:hypothetical protein
MYYSLMFVQISTNVAHYPACMPRRVRISSTATSATAQMDTQEYIVKQVSNIRRRIGKCIVYSFGNCEKHILYDDKSNLFSDKSLLRQCLCMMTGIMDHCCHFLYTGHVTPQTLLHTSSNSQWIMPIRILAIPYTTNI